MVSILSGMYPWISYRTIPREYPSVRFRTLPEEFAHRGYRTLFLSPGDFRFGKSRDFLQHRRFDRILDFTKLRCSGQPFHDALTNGLFTAGWDDACMAPEFEKWIASNERPWFAVPAKTWPAI
jgi:lipoteichoic acid synthase